MSANTLSPLHSFHYIAPPDNGLDVVYADAALLVVNKPAGLLTVPGRGDGKQDCLSRRVQTAFPAALVVHRLDMSTSGLLVMALGQTVQTLLSRLFAKRQVEKRYLAVVAGRPPAEGRIDLPVGADWPNRPRQKIDLAEGKAAGTRYRLLSHDPATDTSRLALWPETGRTHQLRVHLLAIGHPIVGDTLYAEPSVAAKAARLMLHADQLRLPHPDHGESVLFSCPAPF